MDDRGEIPRCALLTHPHQNPMGFGREAGIAAGVGAVMNGIRLIPSSGKVGLSELTPSASMIVGRKS